MWILRFRILDCLHLIQFFLRLFDVSIKSRKSFWLTGNIRNLWRGLEALVTINNIKGSRKLCTWGGLIERKIKDPHSPKWLNNDSFWYSPIFNFMFLHNFCLELFIQCISWQICIRMRVLKFYHFCTRNNFFVIGWKCRKEKLFFFLPKYKLIIFWSSRLEFFQQGPNRPLSIQSKVIRNSLVFCLINHFTALTKIIAVRLALLFAVGLDYFSIYLVFNLTLKTTRSFTNPFEKECVLETGLCIVNIAQNLHFPTSSESLA